MEFTVTPQGFLTVMAVIAAGITVWKYVTSIHDRAKKWDDYDKQIVDVKQKIDDYNIDTTSKIQQIQAEQCMQTFVLEAVLDGLHQLNCNGKVTEASEKLHKHINKQAHGQDNA